MSNPDGGHRALLSSCLSKLTCFNKEEAVSCAGGGGKSSAAAPTAAAVGAPRSASSNELKKAENGDVIRIAPSMTSSTKREQTKQWLQDLSTIAQYDVTTSGGDCFDLIGSRGNNNNTMFLLERKAELNVVKDNYRGQQQVQGQCRPYVVDHYGYVHHRLLNIPQANGVGLVSAESQSELSSCGVSSNSYTAADSISTVSTQSSDNFAPIVSVLPPPVKSGGRRRSLPPIFPPVETSQGQAPVMIVPSCSGANRRRSHPPRTVRTMTLSSKLTSDICNVLPNHGEGPSGPTAATGGGGGGEGRPSSSNRRRSLPTAPPPHKVSSLPSIASTSTASSQTMNTELVTIKLLSGVGGLGITVVGQSSGGAGYAMGRAEHAGRTGGDLGIFVGCVKPGGAAAASGRVRAGDWILEVNGVDLGRLSNDAALDVLRAEASRGGSLNLLLAKYQLNVDVIDGNSDDGTGSTMTAFDEEDESDTEEERREYNCRQQQRHRSAKRIDAMVASTPYLPPRHVAEESGVQASRQYATRVMKLRDEHRGAIDARRASSVALDAVGQNALPVRQFLEGSGMSAGELKVGGGGTGQQYIQPGPVGPLAPRKKSDKQEALPPMFDGGCDDFNEGRTIMDNYYDNIVPVWFRNDQREMSGDRVLQMTGGFSFHEFNNSRAQYDSHPTTRGSSGAARGACMPSSFLGRDLVDWIQSSVPGLTERVHAIQYSTGLLRAGYISAAAPGVGMSDRRGTGGAGVFDERGEYVIGVGWGGRGEDRHGPLAVI